MSEVGPPPVHNAQLLETAWLVLISFTLQQTKTKRIATEAAQDKEQKFKLFSHCVPQ